MKVGMMGVLEVSHIAAAANASIFKTHSYQSDFLTLFFVLHPKEWVDDVL